MSLRGRKPRAGLNRSPKLLNEKALSQRSFGESSSSPQASARPPSPAPGIGSGALGSGGSPPVRDHHAPVVRFLSPRNFELCHTTSAPPSESLASPDGSPRV